MDYTKLRKQVKGKRVTKGIERARSQAPDIYNGMAKRFSDPFKSHPHFN